MSSMIKTAEDLLNEKGTEIIAVPPDTTIYEALKIMVERGVGAMLVKREGKIVGIWTERDLMHNTIEPGFDPKSACIGEYMTTKLVSCPIDPDIYALADRILGLRLRHLLIEREGEYIGILSLGDILRANLATRLEQLEEMNRLMHLEYYDQWRWKKRHRK